MAAVVTVHGTFASGDVQGEKWWQKGGPLEQDIRRFVDADDTELHFVPIPWSGANSETERRKAAHELLRTIRCLEEKGQRYFLIGHSHGGSVIALSLLEAVNKRLALPGLARWITVGTPFISFRKERFLFSRVSNLGKSTLLTLFTVSMLFSLAFAFNELRHGFNLWGISRVLAPFVLAYGIMHYLSWRQLHIYNKKNWRNFRNRYEDIWVPLNHKDDEAIESLRAIQHLQVQIFGQRFALAPLNLIGAAIVPILIIIIVLSSFLMKNFAALFGVKINPFAEDGGWTDWTSNIEFLADRLFLSAMNFANLSHRSVEPLFSAISDESIRSLSEGAFSLVTVFVVPSLCILFLGYVLMVGIRLAATRVSFFLSRILNPLTLSQLRSSAYGNTTEAEFAVSASDSPFWMAKVVQPLPEDLSERLSSFSDAEAAKSIPRLRSAIKTLALPEGGVTDPDAFAGYLSWNELIHTSYFRMPVFRKLIAYIIADEKGFHATESLASDEDCELLRSWYQELLLNYGSNESNARSGSS